MTKNDPIPAYLISEPRPMRDANLRLSELIGDELWESVGRFLWADGAVHWYHNLVIEGLCARSSD